MKELSLHILDIANNSVTANADFIEIVIEEDLPLNKLIITISDNGKGMDSKLLAQVRDPFTTSRKTRQVGLGIPLFENAALICGGSFDIKSAPDSGTTVTAAFEHNHIDRQPLGDIVSTLITLIASNPELDFAYKHFKNEKSTEIDTRSIKQLLREVPINTPEVTLWLRDYIKDALDDLMSD